MTDTTLSRPPAMNLDFASGEFWGRDPHPALAWFRANDPIPFDDEPASGASPATTT